jgi:hypothetical protein
MTPQNTRLGIWLMIATAAIFSAQHGIPRHPAKEYNVPMVVVVRFRLFAAFVVALAARASGGPRAVTR